MKKFIIVLAIIILGIFVYYEYNNYISNEKSNEIVSDIKNIKNEIINSNYKFELKDKSVTVFIEEDEIPEFRFDLKVLKEKRDAKNKNIINFFNGDIIAFKIKINWIKVNKLAILIDDVGENLSTAYKFSNIKEKLNFATIPFLRDSKKATSYLRKNGYNVILHMPMESLGSEYLNKRTKDLIRTTMTKKEIINRFEKGLENIGGAKGFNNHMGSKFTSNKEKMEELLEYVKEKNMYYIDSRTTSKSVGYKTAKELNIKTYYCSIFLDNEKNVEYIEKRIKLAVEKTKKYGKLVAIGHYNKITEEALENMIPYIKENGIKLVFLNEVIE
ncbi:divergent polysaccharide deacetylase family protein [Haliovirga abyssi]|nr:divergent polysaccharide deacetylase family protein [Haliovirga abyssi]